MVVYLFPPKTDFVKYADGGYAMITGGAGGIGKSFADQFGKLGINLFLVDFNDSLLKTTKQELETKYPNILIKSKTIDLTELTEEKKYEAFRRELQSMKIGILFNCAGKGLKFDNVRDSGRVWLG